MHHKSETLLIYLKYMLTEVVDNDIISFVVGEWRSLVAHLSWEQGVVGSNPVSPTIFCLYVHQ